MGTDGMDPQRLVEAYLDALARHDYERARALLADTGFSYQSPLFSFSSADAFIQNISLLGGIVQRIERLKVFVDGPDVCHFLDYIIQISDKESTRVVQWARVADGRIQRIENLFDTHRYRMMFERDPDNG